MQINYDDFILMHYNKNVYIFTGVESIDAALEYMYQHTTQDFTHTAVYTTNEDGEGSRVDNQTVWIVYTDEVLPAEFFTKIELSEEGERRKTAIIAEKEVRQAAFDEFIRNNPRT